MTKYFTLPPQYLRTAAIVLLAVAGLSILHVYLSYLNDIVQPLASNPYDAGEGHIRMMIFLWWVLVMLLILRASRQQLAAQGERIKRSVILRSILAGLIFAVSVTGYNPPDIELSAYFFINSIAYGMLLYAFFSIACVERYCTALGAYLLRLLRLPGVCWCGLAFAFVFFMAYHLSWVLFEHFPWIDDTIVQLVHAKFILQGHLVGQSEPLPRFFDMTWMINDGKWYSQYPPGHVFMLALGLLLHHVSMVNPFLGACTCIAVWLLAKELYGPRVAKIAALLAAMCSYLIIFSSEYMSNATSLLMGTLFLWAYFRVLNQRGWRYALIAGLTLGYCFITRPYSTFGLAIPAALYALYLTIARPRTYLLPMAVIAAVFSCFVAFQLYYNEVATGDALTFGYQKLNGIKYNPFTKEAIEKITPERLYKKLYLNLQRLTYFNRMLFEWPVPCLALVALVFSLRGNRRDERLLFLTVASMFISVQFVANTDIGWGPRLVYEINGILLVLCAKAVSLLPAWLRKLSSRHYSLAFYYGGGAMILASFYAVSFQYNLEIPTIKELYVLEGREGNPEFYKSIMQKIIPPALVFVPPEMYHFVSFTNPPNVNNPVIFAIDLGGEDRDLMKQYRRRNTYVVIVNNGAAAVTVKKIQ